MTRQNWTPLLITLALVSATISANARGAAYSIMLDKSRLTDRERVVSLTLKIDSGNILAIDNIPAGWTFKVNNDASADTGLTGGTYVGAGALFRTDLSTLKICIAGNSPGHPSVSGSIDVTTDFSRSRTIRLSARDFRTTPC